LNPEEELLNTVIALKGKRKIGKTQTIRTVDELLRAKYPGASIEHEHRTRAELRVVLTVNGVKIGIESNDDRLIKESLSLFDSLGCEIIICATRTSGGAFTAVNVLLGYEAVWLEQRAQSAPFEQVLSNLAMARHIVEETEIAIVSARPAVLSRAAGARA
jgi:hypothetical protein